MLLQQAAGAIARHQTGLQNQKAVLEGLHVGYAPFLKSVSHSHLEFQQLCKLRHLALQSEAVEKSILLILFITRCRSAAAPLFFLAAIQEFCLCLCIPFLRRNKGSMPWVCRSLGCMRNRYMHAHAIQGRMLSFTPVILFQLIIRAYGHLLQLLALDRCECRATSARE
jgi:hypothetical protein